MLTTLRGEFSSLTYLVFSSLALLLVFAFAICEHRRRPKLASFLLPPASQCQVSTIASQQQQAAGPMANTPNGKWQVHKYEAKS
jgi:hypothetical protein